MISRKRKKLVYSSSSDSEKETEESQNVTAPVIAPQESEKGTRSSERIQSKGRKTFTMPTREEVFSDIPSLKSPVKHLNSLQPRKLINDYTKERNRYNHDPLYGSDEDSADSEIDFINDESEESEHDEYGRASQRLTGKYVGRRIQKIEQSSDTDSSEDRITKAKKSRKHSLLDSSDEESSVTDPKTSQGQRSQAPDTCIPTDSSSKQTEEKLPNQMSENMSPESQESVTICDVKSNVNSESESSDSDIPVCLSSSRCNIIDSDEEDTTDHENRLKSPRAVMMEGKEQTWRKDVLGAYVAKRQERLSEK